MMSYFLTHSPEKTDSDGVKDADRTEGENLCCSENWT